MNDHRIIALISTGNRKEERSAFLFLYKNNFRVIRDYIVKNGGSAVVAEDIFQDTIVIFHQQVKASRFRSESSISTYLFIIAKRLWLKKIARKKHEKLFPLVPETDREFTHQDLGLADTTVKIKAAMDALDAPCREVLELFYFKSFSMEEIKAFYKLGSLQAAKNKKYRCLQKIISIYKKSSNG